MILWRVIKWAIRRFGPATLVALLLLVTALGSVLHGLNLVLRDFDLPLMSSIMAVALLVGWGLAKSPLPGWLAGGVALSLGVEIIVIRVGQLSPALLRVGQALIDLIVSLWAWSRGQGFTPPPILAAFGQALIDINTVLSRLTTWLWAYGQGQPLFDPMAATLFWGLILWGVAAWAGWEVRRMDRPLRALAPAGALLAIALAHTRLSPTPLLFFLAATIPLLALVAHHRRERRWRSERVSFAYEIRTDLTIAVIMLTISLVALAGTIPVLPLRQLNRLTQQLIWGQTPPRNDLMAQALGLNPPAVEDSAFEPVRVGGLPRRHLVGSGPELSEEVVMLIGTDDPPPLHPTDPLPRYYWRSLTYDRYMGRGWLTGPSETVAFAAGEPLTPATTGPQRLLTQQVRIVGEAGNLLYAAGQVVTVDQAVEVARRSPEDIFGITLPGSTYQVESRLPVASPAALRAAPANYPPDIQARYLALPDSIPGRVLALARDLTATAPTPYDRAKAIEGYLRAFPYTLDLPSPPANRDIADYFLFELQRGYCDYYATSMVVLARAAGLPARLAVGYISSSYDPTNYHYVVTAAEAHSWPEIYFPDIGWVTFEPTGGRPALERTSTGPPAAVAPLVPPSSPAPEATERKFFLWAGLFGSGLALLGGGLLAWSWLDHRRLQRLPPAGALTTLQQRLYGHGRRLNTPLQPGETPYEFATALAEQITNLAMRSRWREHLTPARQELAHLTDIYMQALFSPTHANPTDQAQAIHLWQRLRRRLWLAWLLVLRDWK